MRVDLTTHQRRRIGDASLAAGTKRALATPARHDDRLDVTAPRGSLDVTRIEDWGRYRKIPLRAASSPARRAPAGPAGSVDQRAA
jgi:hypothetical protein